MKSMKALAIALGCFSLGLSLSQAVEDPNRMWTDTKGRQLKATFVGLDGDKISLQSDAGQVYTFPLSNLTDADQAIARSIKPAVAYITNDATVAQAAKKIDDLVTKGLRRGAAIIEANNAKATKPQDKRIVPTANPLMSDEQFIRRVYMDIVGHIPTYEQTKDFLDSTSKTKRAEVIKTLLDSPGYGSHLFNYFAEMLRVKDRLEQPDLRGTPYIKWLQEQCESNRPWNEMVYDMISADGKVWKNGAAGYLLRDVGMPLDNLANTLAVFLGTDVSCAQCHDHPFAEWTQYQFYEMAAYFGATTTDLRTAERRAGQSKAKAKETAALAMNMGRNSKLMDEIEEIITKSGGDIKKERNALGNFIGANRYVISDTTENSLRLPMDYKYKNAKPGDAVKPKFIMWTPADKNNPAYTSGGSKRKNETKLRDTFAAWMTHPENPRFAMSIANRMWKRAFGVAVMDPVTNIDDPDKSSNPELLKHLAAEMKRLKFNLKAFMEIVYNTEAYQRESTTDAVPMGEAYYFQGPLLRRMSAEQAWDSYMTLVLGNPDAYKKPLEDLYSRSIDLDLTNPKLDAKTVLMKYAAFRDMGKKEREANGGTLEDAGGDMMMMDKKEGGDAMSSNKTITYGGMVLRRASELEQPARPGSFLAEFGQSPRTLIDGGLKVGSVPQVLTMMNGSSQEMLTNPKSLMFRNMEKLSTMPEKVEALFLSILNRRPTADEQKMATANIGDGGSDGYSNLIWALINTREFIFVQ